MVGDNCAVPERRFNGRHHGIDLLHGAPDSPKVGRDSSVLLGSLRSHGRRRTRLRPRTSLGRLTSRAAPNTTPKNNSASHGRQVPMTAPGIPASRIHTSMPLRTSIRSSIAFASRRYRVNRLTGLIGMSRPPGSAPPTASSVAVSESFPPSLVATMKARFRAGASQTVANQRVLLPLWLSARPPAQVRWTAIQPPA